MTTTRKYQSDFARRYYDEGEANAVLMILDARGVNVPDDARARISTCSDLEQLGARIRRAATAHQVEDLFGGTPARDATTEA